MPNDTLLNVRGCGVAGERNDNRANHQRHTDDFTNAGNLAERQSHGHRMAGLMDCITENAPDVVRRSVICSTT